MNRINDDADVIDNDRLLLKLCCNNALCIQVQRFFESSVTEFLHRFNWLVITSVGPSYQRVIGLGMDQSPPGAFRTRRSYRRKWEDLVEKDVRKTFPDSVLSLFRKIPECTANAEVEWQQSKEALPSFTAQVCGRKRLGVVNHDKK